MTVVDVHAHAIVPDALVRMAERSPDHGPVLVERAGNKYLEYPGRSNLGPLPPAIFDPALRMEAMDRQRVDLQVIAIPPPNFHYHLPPAIGVDFAIIQNDALIGLSDTSPGRLHAFATLPLQDVSASVAEVERLAPHDRVRGVQIGTNIDGVDLDNPRLEPIWAMLESTGLPVWLHPDQRAIAGANRLDDYYFKNLIGLPLESTIALARLVFGGVMERHPGLRFGFVHGGGFAPYQLGRWDHGWKVRPEAKMHIPDRSPTAHLTNVYFDSLTHDPVSLGMLGERVGWDRVLLGSDFPFDMAEPDPVGAVEAIGLDTGNQRLVLEQNAVAFLRPPDRPDA